MDLRGTGSIGESIIPVRTASRDYEVRVGPGVIASIGRLLAALVKSRRTYLVADAGVPSAFIEQASSSLARDGFDVPGVLSLVTSEEHKSLTTVETILNQLSHARMERDDPVVVIGGGCLGDLAGFAAAIYRRGVPVVQVPTTLLAMVDASVGGKTAVNLFPISSQEIEPLRKNMAGAFHQPILVVADTDALASLPTRQFRAGMAECIKHGLLGGMFGDEDLLAWTEANASGLISGDRPALCELISRNITMKARVVEGDEFERTGVGATSRMLLNLGHTFGHALESFFESRSNQGVVPLLHGEAVGLGLLAAARLGVTLGVCESSIPEVVQSMLIRCGLPIEVTHVSSGEELFRLMLEDKKSIGKRLHFVVPTRSGHARLIECPSPPDPVIAAIESLVKNR